jgi:ADP-ribosyl-[dinitrogen reductase] hydrolase
LSSLPSLHDRLLGCLLGGALGDAWGGPFEGSKGPVKFEIPSRPAFSDDTQLTTATCESIIERERVEPEQLASNFARWFVEGRIQGIGASTLKAMRDLAAGNHWALAGSRGEYAAGNGAAMRIAPLAFLLEPAIPQNRTIIRDVCRITHHNDEAYIGALAVILALRSILDGSWSADRSFLAIVRSSLPDSAVRDRIEELVPLQLPVTEVASLYGASGHVVDTVPLALYCAQSIYTHPLPVVLAQTIGVGGDTDTIASIAGQLAGAVTGTSGIPREYFGNVSGANEVIHVFEKFAEFAAKLALRQQLRFRNRARQPN